MLLRTGAITGAWSRMSYNPHVPFIARRLWGNGRWLNWGWMRTGGLSLKTIGRVTRMLGSSEVADLIQQRREGLEDALHKAESEIERFCQRARVTAHRRAPTERNQG